MTRPGIEPRSPGPLANTLTAGPIIVRIYSDSIQTNSRKHQILNAREILNPSFHLILSFFFFFFFFFFLILNSEK